MATSWSDLREERAREPGFDEAYAQAALRVQFGRALRDARTQAALSQAELARRIGSTQSYIARLEGGGADVKLSTLVRLAEVFGQPFHVTGAGVNAA
jgi:ribosome-binding protein aMBF1 (putative translation factor)